MTNIFWEIHKDLPREGPGDTVSTLKAFWMMEELPVSFDLLDVGCGPGLQTIDLAKHMLGTVTAVDTHQPFLDELQQRAERAGQADKVKVQNESMFDLRFEPGSFDVIWSEGAIYIMGFEEGLKKFRPLLKPRGYVAVTEVSWLKPNPPGDVRQFWQENYPGMKSVEENRSALTRAGYREIGHFTVPESSWWEDYFHPLAKRLDALEKQYADDAEAMKQIHENRREMEVFRKYSDFYGYVFYIMQVI